MWIAPYSDWVSDVTETSSHLSGKKPFCQSYLVAVLRPIYKRWNLNLQLSSRLGLSTWRRGALRIGRLCDVLPGEDCGSGPHKRASAGLEDWGYTPGRATRRRAEVEPIKSPSPSSREAAAPISWHSRGSWVAEITLERRGDGDRAVVRQQHRCILAVSNRQDDTQVI